MDNVKLTSMEEVKDYIQSIDFSMIIKKMVKHQGWRETDAQAISKMYRNFLFIKRKYGHEYKLPPSEEIDEFWHNHILDSEKYRTDCLHIFGTYLDHYPYFGIDGKTNLDDLNQSFGMTQKLYYQEFGEYIYQVRNIFSKISAGFKALKRR